MIRLSRATQPTIYFIGVTTAQSSIMKLFPLWAKALRLRDTVIKGIDLAIHDSAEQYREVVGFIKGDKFSLGALVTTHKIDLYNAAKDMFEYLDPYARMFGELSSISKRDGRLQGHAKDPISSALAMEAFIPKNHWKEHGGEAFIMGAGGSAIAISATLVSKTNRNNIPTKIIVSNRSKPRLIEIERMIKDINPDIPAEFHLSPEAKRNDEILKIIKPFSLIINGTGLGKDRPGSPLTDACEYPERGLVWELNYRGELDFMRQALKQKLSKYLHVEDGWIYFLHGWTQVIAEVFHIEISDNLFARLEELSQQIGS